MEHHASRGLYIKALEERPEIPPDLLWLWTGYNRLATTRQLTDHGQGPISWLAVNKYAREMGYWLEERDFLWDVVSRLDSKFLSLMRAKAKANPPPKKK